MKRRELLARSTAFASLVTGSLALPIGKSAASEASGDSNKPAAIHLSADPIRLSLPLAALFQWLLSFPTAR